MPSNLRLFKYNLSDNSIHSQNQSDFGVFSKHELNMARFNLEKSFQNISFCQSALNRPACFISEISKRHGVYCFTLPSENCAYTYLLSAQSHTQSDISKQLDECAKALSFVEKMKEVSSEIAVFTINDCLSKHINQLLCLKKLTSLKPELCKEALELNILTKVVCDYLTKLYKGKIIINTDTCPVTALVNPEIYSGILVYTISQLAFITESFEIDVKVTPNQNGDSILSISTNTKDAEKARLIQSHVLRAFDGLCKKAECDFKNGAFCIMSSFEKAKIKEYKVGTPKFDQKLYDIQSFKETLSALSFVSYI